MGFLNFLVWLLAIYLGLRLFWALFGGLIGRWLVVTFVRKVQEQAERQANARARTGANYQKEFYVAPDVKATIRPEPERSAAHKNVSSLADSDVEFEELRDDARRDSSR